MKTWIIVGVVIVVVWMLLRRLSGYGLAVTTGPSPLKLAAASAVEAGALVCTIELTGCDRPLFLESLSTRRTDADAIGLGTPAGLALVPLPATPRDDAEWVAQWNRDNVRFAGRIVLPPGQPVRIVFPLAGDPSRSLLLQGTVTNGRRFMGSMRFLRIQHGEAPAAEPVPIESAVSE
jgi:hypothetical protein